ncbi:MAG: hypothetical protein CMQ05_11615, partial [Gammaproteobacteria bacterium]|nr:hypothetical protein [Gammaproteobacteria bacterium]
TKGFRSMQRRLRSMHKKEKLRLPIRFRIINLGSERLPGLQEYTIILPEGQHQFSLVRRQQTKP